jgi:hypothetical protein
MRRLEAKGKGILLLHDIQARTVAALPKILRELKARGYRIVHVVPATADLAATPTEPQQWRLHPSSDSMAIAHWPGIPSFVFAESAMLPGPWLSDSYWNDEWLTPAERANRRVGAVPLPRPAPWPRQLPMPLPSAVNALPVPGQSVFELRDWPRLAARTVAALPSRRGEPTVSSEHAAQLPAEAGASRRTGKGKPQLGRSGSANAAQAGRRALKRLVQVKKRSV